jgi:DHA2 family multidrug resistance protein-like MFS transporter
VALETLAGAETAAGTHPDPMRLEVLEPARDAFTNGLNLAAGIAAAIVAALAVVAIVLLRDVPSSTVIERAVDAPEPERADQER